MHDMDPYKFYSRNFSLRWALSVIHSKNVFRHLSNVTLRWIKASETYA